MNQSKIQDLLTQNVSTLKGVGNKTKKLLKKKKIEKVSDLLWNFPQGYTDRTNLQTLDKLEIVTDYKHLQIREIKPNGTYSRRILSSDMDVSGEPQETQDICNAVWTDEVKEAWAAKQAESVPA